METDGGGDGEGNLGVGNDVVVVVGTAHRYCTRGLGIWAKNPKPSSGCSVSGVPVENIGGANGGGKEGVVNEVVVVVGTADRYCTRGLGIWAKNPKPSGGCSVSGAPVENDGGADGGGMLGVGNEMVELVGRADQYRTWGLGV